MEAHEATASRERTGGLPTWLLGLGPLLLIVAAIGAFAALGGPGLGERRGVPAEELVVERTVLKPGSIALTVRNDGPDAVTIAQAQVNDAFVQFSGPDGPIDRLRSAVVTVRQPWIEGEAYEVVLMTSTGGTIAHEIPVAVETPDEDGSFFALMALLGVYVGVIPVALGMLWLPWIRRVPPNACEPCPASSKPSSVASMARNASRPTVRAITTRSQEGGIRRIHGSHSMPSATGITPT